MYISRYNILLTYKTESQRDRFLSTVLSTLSQSNMFRLFECCFILPRHVLVIRLDIGGWTLVWVMFFLHFSSIPLGALYAKFDFLHLDCAGYVKLLVIFA